MLRSSLTGAGAAPTVAEVVRAVAPQGGHLVGLSLGGYVALDLAAELPELVLSATASGVNVLPFRRPGLMRAAGREQPLILQSLSRIAGAFPYGRACLAPGVGHAWRAGRRCGWC